MGLQRQDRKTGADLAVEERAEKTTVKTAPTTFIESEGRPKPVCKPRALETKG